MKVLLHKVMRIAHIADVHYRGLSRHTEYRQVFSAFAESVKKQRVDHIYVGGDIFHTKTSGLSPEYIDEMAWWLTTLSSAAPLHITLGNHDGNLVNSTRQDAVTPIVNALNNPNVHLYKESGVYQFEPGFNWCIFSLFDEQNWKHIEPVEGEVNIACYHGPVWGAKTESDWLIQEGLSLEFFQDFDFALLGDIHKTQFLDFKEVEMIIDEDDLEKYPDAVVLERIDD